MNEIRFRILLNTHYTNVMNRQKKGRRKKELRSQTQNLEEMKPHKQTAFITVQRSTDFIENVLRE